MWLLKPKHGLASGIAEELMSSYGRPDWASPTVTAAPGGYEVHVDTLAWGVTRMLRNLFADTGQADAAEATAKLLLQCT